MATPTWAETWTQTKNLCILLDNLENYQNTTSGANWVSDEDDLIQSLEGDFTQEIVPLLRSARSSLSAITSRGTLRSLFSPFIREMGRIVGATESSSLDAIVDRVYEYMVDQSEDLNTRALTLGSVSAGGSNVGNMTVIRCAVDENDFPLQTHLDTKTIECVQDQGQVNEHEEVWEIRGAAPYIDNLDFSGSGQIGRLVSANARATERYLINPSFSSDTAASPATTLTGWTVSGSVANLDIDSSTTYRAFAGDTTPRSLQFTASETISQIIQDNTAARLDPTVPWILGCAIYRDSAATGTLTMRLGATSRAITIGGLTDNAWTPSTVVTTPATDHNLWYKQFNEQDLDIQFAMATLATGTVYIDDIYLQPMTLFDGHYWAVVPNGATHTSPLRGDSYTFADSLSSEGIIQKWWWRAGFRDLPSQSDASETITDPS
jgi:hypothetical protein